MLVPAHCEMEMEVIDNKINRRGLKVYGCKNCLFKARTYRELIGYAGVLFNPITEKKA